MKDFGKLIAPFKDKLYRFALRIVDQQDIAEDVVQEVLIKLWSKRDRINEIENLEAWCMRLTRNKSIDKLRSKHRRTEDIEGHFGIQDKSKNPEDTTVSSDIYNRIKIMISNLPEKQKLVIQLRDIEGMKYQEIADILGMNMSQVKVNLFRARNAIKEQLIKLNIHGSK